jgi:DNA-binding response OmpR family regulator
MEMLMEYPKEVVTSVQFIEHIWGWNTDIENNVIWVYISNLRTHLKKLNAPFDIKTIRGIGYLLKEKK